MLWQQQTNIAAEQQQQSVINGVWKYFVHL